MKNNKIQSVFTLLAFGVLLFAGCQKDGMTTLRLRIADFASDSKVYMDGNTPHWVAGDLISINGECCTIASNGTATVNSSDVNYKAVYPYSIFSSYASGVTHLFIRQNQTYRVSGENQIIDAPMAANANAATSGTTTLVFKNIGALLAVQVVNNATDNNQQSRGALTVDKITVTATEMRLWGKASLVMENLTNGSYQPIYTIDADQDNVQTNDYNTINLNFATGVEIAHGASHVFYISVPDAPDNISNQFTISVHAYNGSGEQTFTRSQTRPGSGNIIVNTMANVPFNLNEAGGQWESNDIPAGAIRGGVFSVSADIQVYFSAGNLQYKPSEDEWRIAEHQWDYVGAYIPTPPTNPNAVHYGNVEGGSNLYNNDVAPYWTYWIDLFGYGTSGYNPNNSTTQAMPYDFVTSKTYGPNRTLTGSFVEYDWGYHNAITYGNTSVPAHKWRTMQAEEWNYLLNTRTINSLTGLGNTYAFVTVNGVPGIIIYPDNYTGDHPSRNNNFELIDLNDYPSCAFLPCAGRRNVANDGTTPSVSNLPVQATTNYMGYYWTTQYNRNPMYIYFPSANTTLAWNSDIPRYTGCSVRLVYDVN